MALTTDAAVTTALAAVLDTAEADLVSTWATNITRCHARAASAVLSALLARGYTSAQITASDQGAVWEKELSLYFLSMKPQGQGVFDKEAVAAFDVREEMKTAILTASGAALEPAGTLGVPNYGEIDASGDIFAGPWTGDEEDETTRW